MRSNLSSSFAFFSPFVDADGLTRIRRVFIGFSLPESHMMRVKKWHKSLPLFSFLSGARLNCDIMKCGKNRFKSFTKWPFSSFHSNDGFASWDRILVEEKEFLQIFLFVRLPSSTVMATPHVPTQPLWMDSNFLTNLFSLPRISYFCLSLFPWFPLRLISISPL